MLIRDSGDLGRRFRWAEDDMSHHMLFLFVGGRLILLRFVLYIYMG